MVDDVIKTAHGLIPIDAKFPMENFRALTKATTDREKDDARKLFTIDVKRHIKAISTKYVVTQEGTTDYALMYVPSESIYYEIVNDPALYDFSSESRVLMVSPTTFYAFLKAILMSFEGQKIEEQAQNILRSFRSLSHDYQHINHVLETTAKHISNANNSMQSALTLSDSFEHKMKSSVNLEDKEEPPKLL